DRGKVAIARPPEGFRAIIAGNPISVDKHGLRRTKANDFILPACLSEDGGQRSVSEHELVDVDDQNPVRARARISAIIDEPLTDWVLIVDIDEFVFGDGSLSAVLA